MGIWGQLKSWLPWQRRRREADLERELRNHLELEAEEQQDAGISAEEAAWAARRALGNTAQIKEDVRAAWGFHWLETLGQDIRYGLRQLRRNPGFTAVAVITLALGIGANTAIFSVVDAMLLRPLPYPQSDRLEQVMRHYSFGSLPAVTATKFVFWRDRNQVFSALAAYDILAGAFNLTTGGGRPEHVSGLRVSDDFFRVLGVSPALGRGFTAEEDRPGGPNVSILSHSLWEQRFGGDPSIIGKQISLSGTPYTVVGVMPAGFQSNPVAQLWTPMRPVLDPQQHANIYLVLGRLKPGVTRQHARREMASVAIQFQHQYPDLMGKTESISVTDYQQSLTGDIRPALLVLMAAVGLVLLIACANVANLLLARALGRNREFAIRTAIGAGHARLVRQLLTESVLLALAGSALGLLFANVGLRSLLGLVPASIPQMAYLPGSFQRIAQARLDMRVLLFTAVVALLVGIIFGLAPTFQTAGIDINDSLREGGGRTSGAARHGRVRSFLVAGEIGLSLVLLAGAALLIKTFVNLQNVNPGFDPQNVLTMKLSLSNPKYATTVATAQLFRQVLDRVNRTPGVERAAFINSLPMEVGPDLPFQIAGHKDNSGGEAQYRTVTPGYFSTMRIPVLRGRVFSHSDNAQSAGVVIINRKLAEDFFPGQNPVGQHMTIGVGTGPQFADEVRQIVGVMGNTRERGLNNPPTETMFIPSSQLPNPTNEFEDRIAPARLVVRTRVAPMGLSALIAREVLDADSTQPVFQTQPLEAIVGQSIAQEHFDMVLLEIFAALALLLASIGLYGVISYSVAQRTHEIGIRVALGARKVDVLRMVMGQGLKLALIGVGIGIAGALALTRFLSSLLYGVKPTDPLTFIIVSLVLVAVALVACYIPARRASKVDPMVALRYE